MPCFNPRPREGATRNAALLCAHCQRFNPRPREGATTLSRVKLTNWFCFNPRPREGATHSRPEPWFRAVCFNPRPREGATRGLRRAFLGLGVSIHAPVKGRPLEPQLRGLRPLGFNPRPREGATSGVQALHAARDTGRISANVRPAASSCSSQAEAVLLFPPQAGLGAIFEPAGFPPQLGVRGAASFFMKFIVNSYRRAMLMARFLESVRGLRRARGHRPRRKGWWQPHKTLEQRRDTTRHTILRRKNASAIVHVKSRLRQGETA